MKKKNYFMVYWTAMIVCFSATLFGVTDDEINKIRSAMPDQPVVKPGKSRTMLVFSLCNGFKHSCIPYWKQALDIMSEKTGAFKVVHSDDMGVFCPDALKQFDVICFNNTTKLVPNQDQQKAILDFINSGKGIVGIHAATDNFYEWDQGAMMMGGQFKGHPWTGDGTWSVKLDEPGHPLLKSFEGQNFKVNDEIYRTLPPYYSRQNLRVLMSLDMSDPTTKNTKDVTPEDMDTGISWIKPVGSGRLFYCALGHNNHLVWNKAVLEHYLAGIQYAAGDLKVDDKPLAAAACKPDLSNLDALIEQVVRCDWNSNRADAIKLEALIGSYYGDTDTLGQIEVKLTAALQSTVTMAGRDFVCRQLAVIGTGKSVPALSAMLMDPQTSNMARYALERIPGKDADEALVNAAQKTKDKEIQIGVITTLGARKNESVVFLSQQLLTDTTVTDPAVVAALIQSLGNIGTEAAAAELIRVQPQMTGAALGRWPDAMLMCADAMQEAGHKPQAIAIYQKLYKTDPSSIVQAAALRAWVKLDSADIESLLKQLIGGKDTVLQSAAIQSLVFMGHNTSFLKTIASSAADLPPDAQIHLVTAMPRASREVGCGLAVVLLRSDQESVRIAACQALEQAGDKTAVEKLARIAAEAQSRTEREAAQEALYRIAGKDVDAEILQMITALNVSQDNENVIVELIKATVNRQIKESPQVLLGTAGSDNKKISDESIQALQSLVGPEYVEKLVDLLISKPGSVVENAIVVVAQKIPCRDDRARIMLDRYPKMAGNETVQVSMLSVMGKLGDVHAVSLLKKEFDSSNPVIRQAAFRAMTDWPGSDFIDTMKALAAEKSSDEKNRILAFRAYIRMLDDSVTQANRKNSIDALIAAYPMAPRVEEKKIVIGAIGHFDDIATLTFLQTLMTNPDLKAEVEVSLIQICEKLLPQNPSAVKPVLESLKNTSSNESIKKKAGELLALN